MKYKMFTILFRRMISEVESVDDAMDLTPRCTECAEGTASDKINKVPDGSCLPCDPGLFSPVHPPLDKLSNYHERTESF